MGPTQIRFSIIVPSYKRPAQLAACLQAIARLDYPRDGFEVIVVDDGSKAPPKAVIESFRTHMDVQLLVQPHAGPGPARNAGAAKARGKYLAFTDDDCLPAPDWLQTLAVRFEKDPESAIGGRALNAFPYNPYSTASQLLVDYLYSYYNAKHDQARFFASMNLALPAERYLAMGGFDGSWPYAAGEDRELCDRWVYHGFRMVYAPEVNVYHAHALTFRTFCRQHFYYGRGAFHFHKARAQRGLGRIKVEPLIFYRNLLRRPFSPVQERRAVLLLTLLLVSQVVNAAGFFWECLTYKE
jgi:glycosyltransferase involved in cell wall biosynthesis